MTALSIGLLRPLSDWYRMVNRCARKGGPPAGDMRQNARYGSTMLTMALSKLGRYDLVRVLGKGAMGTVYEAYDPHLERRVAIKTIAVMGLSEAALRDYELRFRVEALSCARLQHPHIVSVYDAGRDGDTAYLVMEFVEGKDLKEHLDQGATFTLDQTLRIMRELLSALAYAHAQNVVHRDVKPGNLLIEADGRVKLTDFGVARIQDADDATRTRGLMVGTLKYMSPEQVQGQAIDARADLFSAGIVLYQLLTARQPFIGDSEFAIIAQIIGVDPPVPSSVQPALPEALDAVVACALAKSPEQRYASAHDFADALALACGQVQDRSVAPPPRVFGLGSGATRARTASIMGAGSTATATVAQELELVYWKDVRDSDDALDVQGFLDRFPDGIYADLARGKLRRLGVVMVGGQTITRVEPRLEPSSPFADASAGADRSDGNSSPAPGDTSISRNRRNPLRIAGLAAGLAMVLVAAVGVGWWFSDAPPKVAPSARSTPSSMEKEPSAAVGPVQTAGKGTATAESDAARTVSEGEVPAANAQVRPVGQGEVVPATDSAKGSGDPAVVMESAPAARSQRSTVSGSRATDRATAGSKKAAAEYRGPEQACAGRVLLGYQICLSQKCAEAAFASAPVCVQRKAAEQALRQRQTNRN